MVLVPRYEKFLYTKSKFHVFNKALFVTLVYVGSLLYDNLCIIYLQLLPSRYHSVNDTQETRYTASTDGLVI